MRRSISPSPDRSDDPISRAAYDGTESSIRKFRGGASGAPNGRMAARGSDLVSGQFHRPIEVGSGDLVAAVASDGLVELFGMVGVKDMAKLVHDQRIDLQRLVLHQIAGQMDLFSIAITHADGRLFEAFDPARRIGNTDALGDLPEAPRQILLGSHLHEVQTPIEDLHTRDRLIEPHVARRDDRVTGPLPAIAVAAPCAPFDPPLKQRVIAPDLLVENLGQGTESQPLQNMIPRLDDDIVVRPIGREIYLEGILPKLADPAIGSGPFDHDPSQPGLLDRFGPRLRPGSQLLQIGDVVARHLAPRAPRCDQSIPLQRRMEILRHAEPLAMQEAEAGCGIRGDLDVSPPVQKGDGAAEAGGRLGVFAPFVKPHAMIQPLFLGFHFIRRFSVRHQEAIQR